MGLFIYKPPIYLIRRLDFNESYVVRVQDVIRKIRIAGVGRRLFFEIDKRPVGVVGGLVHCTMRSSAIERLANVLVSAR